MIRVLMINYEYPPLGGGGANATKHILNSLSENKDIKIDLVTTSSIGKYYVQQLGPRIRIFFLPIKKKNIHFWKQKEIIDFLLKSWVFTRRLIKKNTYDVIHAFFGFPSGVIPYLLGWKPYIVSLRGSDVPGFNPRFGFQYIILKPLFRRIWKNAAVVTTNSEGLRQLAKQTLAEKKYLVIYNGVDTQTFISKNNYHRNKDAPFRILTVSRLIRRKRIDDLIKAAKFLIDKGLNVELTIIGEGKSKNKLMNLARSLNINQKVKFLGYISHENLPQYYISADVFVLPSLNEGMSNTVLEAMASGLPLILTDVGGTKELISNNGLVIPVRSPIKLAQALEQLYHDNKMCEYMGIHSKNHVRRFDWKEVAFKYYQLYSKSYHVSKVKR